MKKKLFLLLLPFFILILITGCNETTEKRSEKWLKGTTKIEIIDAIKNEVLVTIDDPEEIAEVLVAIDEAEIIYINNMDFMEIHSIVFYNDKTKLHELTYHTFNQDQEIGLIGVEVLYHVESNLLRLP